MKNNLESIAGQPVTEKYKRTKLSVALTFTGALLSSLIPRCSGEGPTKPEEPSPLDLPGTVVFASNRSGDWDLYMTGFNSEEQTNITPNSPENDSYPIWTGNGQKIIFASDRSGSFELYRINNVADPESDLEQLTNLGATSIVHPEISPNKDYVLFICSLPTVGPRPYKYDLITGESSLIVDTDIPKHQVRFLDENTLLLSLGVLTEYDLITGDKEKYVYNYDALITTFDDGARVTTADVSKKTGKAFAPINYINAAAWYRVFRWDYASASEYRPLTGGKIQDNDMWRDFRIIDIGESGDYVLGAERIYDPERFIIGDWKVGVWKDSEGFALHWLKNQSGDNRFPDWTSVDHINP